MSCNDEKNKALTPLTTLTPGAALDKLVDGTDTSESMTLPDGGGATRWVAQRDAWRTLARGIEGIDDSLSVRLLAYDKATRPLKSEPSALDQLVPDGEFTDLSTATTAMIQAAATAVLLCRCRAPQPPLPWPQ